MRFYRPAGTVSAMTFDLDDTLYENSDVILTTVEKTHQALQDFHPVLQNVTLSDYELAREEIKYHQPDSVHDVTLWREKSVYLLMQKHGLSEQLCQQGASHVMSVFAAWRSQVHMPQSTHDVLQYLAERVPLAAITNGNADPQLMGIAGYFRFILRAGPDGRAKPAQDMYRLAASHLGLPAGEILHVGDDLTTDVAGSLLSGFQSCWINPFRRNLMTACDARLLPHMEISRLDSLTTLV